METVKNVTIGLFHGLWDSIRGMTLLLHIDDELNRKKAEEDAERQQKRFERDNRRRSPSPCPSSASAMIREEIAEQIAQRQKESADERTIESIRNKPKSNKADELIKGEKKIAKQVLKCCLLNGGFTWLSIVLFEELLLPTLKFVLTICYGEQSEMLPFIWGWLKPILSIMFGMMWVLPIFLLSKIVSSLWFADIANAAFKVRKGPPQLIQSTSKLIADFLFSLLVQALFLVQSMLVNLLPIKYVGATLCFVHLCFLYSLYSFEYKWFNQGWELHRRLSYIEYNWPYFIGFGIPLTIVTSMSSSIIVSSCIFSIFFPLFILSGNEAKPLVGATERPLRLFSPVIFVSNLFFNRGPNRIQHQQRVNVTAKLTQQQQQQLLLKQQLQKQREKERLEEQQRRSQSLNKSQYRYAQPPPLRTSSARTITPDRNSVPYFGSGMRPLVPTPVPGAPTATHH